MGLRDWLRRLRKPPPAGEAEPDRVRRYQRVLEDLGVGKAERDKLWPRPKLRVLRGGKQRDEGG